MDTLVTPFVPLFGGRAELGIKRPEGRISSHGQKKKGLQQSAVIPNFLMVPRAGFGTYKTKHAVSVCYF